MSYVSGPREPLLGETIGDNLDRVAAARSGCRVPRLAPSGVALRVDEFPDDRHREDPHGRDAGDLDAAARARCRRVDRDRLIAHRRRGSEGGEVMPRIEPVPRDDWPTEMRDALAAMRPTAPRYAPAQREDRPQAGNTLDTFALHPDLARAFFTFNGHVLYATTLTERQREILVLRVADVAQVGVPLGPAPLPRPGRRSHRRGDGKDRVRARRCRSSNRWRRRSSVASTSSWTRARSAARRGRRWRPSSTLSSSSTWCSRWVATTRSPGSSARSTSRSTPRSLTC